MAITAGSMAAIFYGVFYWKNVEIKLMAIAAGILAAIFYAVFYVKRRYKFEFGWFGDGRNEGMPSKQDDNDNNNKYNIGWFGDGLKRRYAVKRRWWW